MTTLALSNAERRVALRFSTSFAAELVSGTVLVPVTVLNLSVAGCGVVIMSGDPDLPDRIDSRGLIHLPAVDQGTFGTILPVIIRNVRCEYQQLVYGLEFGPLLTHQSRKLQEVLDAMIQND